MSIRRRVSFYERTLRSLVFLIVLGHSANAMADAIDDIAARFVASEVRRTGGDEYEDARSVKRSGAKGEGLNPSSFCTPSRVSEAETTTVSISWPS